MVRLHMIGVTVGSAVVIADDHIGAYVLDQRDQVGDGVLERPPGEAVGPGGVRRSGESLPDPLHPRVAIDARVRACGEGGRRAEHVARGDSEGRGGLVDLGLADEFERSGVFGLDRAGHDLAFLAPGRGDQLDAGPGGGEGCDQGAGGEGFVVRMSMHGEHRGGLVQQLPGVDGHACVPPAVRSVSRTPA